MKAMLCLGCGDLRYGSAAPCLSCGSLASGNPALDLLFSDQFYRVESLEALGRILGKLRAQAASSDEATTAFLWFFANAFPGEFEMRPTDSVKTRFIRLLAAITLPPLQLIHADGSAKPMRLAEHLATVSHGARPADHTVTDTAAPRTGTCALGPGSAGGRSGRAADRRLQVTWHRAFDAFPEFRTSPRGQAEPFNDAAYARKAKALAAVLAALRAVPGSDFRHRDRERAAELLRVLMEGLRGSTGVSHRWCLRLGRALRALSNPVLFRNSTGHGALGTAAAIVAALAHRLEDPRGSVSVRAA